MTRYRVLIGTVAEDELQSAYDFIREHSEQQAYRWRASILDAAESLEVSPARCPLAPENGTYGLELRQRLHGNYRLIFMIQNLDVMVLHIRHTSRGKMSPDELLPPDTN